MGPLQLYLKGLELKWAANSNIDPGDPGPPNLIHANHFKWAPINNIDPGSPGPSI